MRYAGRANLVCCRAIPGKVNQISIYHLNRSWTLRSKASFHRSIDRPAELSIHPFQRPLQIFPKILHILQPNVEPYNPVPVVGAVLVAMQVISHCEAGDSCPAVANFKQFQIIDEMQYLLFREFFSKNNGEDSCRAGEVTLPELMSRTRRERGMQDQFHFWPLRQPLREIECC